VPVLAALHLCVLGLAVRLVSRARGEVTVTWLLAAPTIALNLGALFLHRPALELSNLAMLAVFYGPGSGGPGRPHALLGPAVLQLHGAHQHGLRRHTSAGAPGARGGDGRAGGGRDVRGDPDRAAHRDEPAPETAGPGLTSAEGGGVRRAWIGIAIAAAVAALLYWTTLSHVGVECEVCMRFEGRERCATAAGPGEHEAEQAAIMTACGVVAGGVTDGIRCQSTPPLSRRCAAR
jgi:hypothetical protein